LAQLGAHQLVIGAPVIGGNFTGLGGRDDSEHHRSEEAPAPRPFDHSMVMSARSLAAKPLSPVHSKAIEPLSVATVKNEMNGLAAIAGDSSARKISSPF
jgi:hypothetical protein